MTTTEPREQLSVIDLTSPPPPPPLRNQSARRREAVSWRIVLGVLLGIVGVLFVSETFITGFLHDQRQRHLAADYLVRRPAVAEGQAWGIIQIPTLKLNQVVVEGDRLDRLRSGPVHRVSSVKPGETGTVVIIGHRSRYGGPFAKLRTLAPNDLIAIQAKNGTTVNYKVECTAIVKGDTSPLLTRADGKHLLLVTASEGVLPTEHLVVQATAGSVESSGAKECPAPSSAPAKGSDSLDPSAPISGAMGSVVYAAFAVLAGLVVFRLLALHRIAVRVMAVIPFAVFGLILVLSMLDFVLPSAM